MGGWYSREASYLLGRKFQFNRSGYISRALNVSEVQNLSYLRGHIPVTLEPVLDLLDSLE